MIRIACDNCGKPEAHLEVCDKCNFFLAICDECMNCEVYAEKITCSDCLKKENGEVNETEEK